MNNIYAKTVHKKPYSAQITSARGFEERWKLPQRGPGRSLGSFCFNRIFHWQKGAFASFIDL